MPQSIETPKHMLPVVSRGYQESVVSNEDNNPTTLVGFICQAYIQQIEVDRLLKSQNLLNKRD
jgi:hypothetical protein